MIDLHDAHLQKLESECLLQSDTIALRQAILSVLDLTLRFRDALAMDDEGGAPTTALASPRIERRFHHSRRELRGAIQYARTPREAHRASDSESDLEEHPLGHRPLDTLSYPTQPISGDGHQRFGDIYETQDELNKLVRFIHREVERLADNTSGAASAFSVLAFALEDWGR
ncbi:hypothetical protein F5148DRAFT_289448 [Russula earlei]|uniref:Uncharacterized protein n=1 Tax=Russula earlei TaxID=71964 RepID=A0ACC0UNY2_9AGAM|nr:hypothetical protein F5148DRAFT_289448 [Russula earlei]